MVLDIVSSNMWERPIYFAITVRSDSHLGLQKYFQQVGMAYKFVPVEFGNKGPNKRINTEEMYELLIDDEKFRFGGLEKGEKIYMEPSGFGSALTLKYFNFQRLAQELLTEGMQMEDQATMLSDLDSNATDIGGKTEMMIAAQEKKQKAINILDKMIKAFPNGSMPYDYTMLNIADFYRLLDQNEKAMDIIRIISSACLDDLDYYLGLYTGSTSVQYRQEIEANSSCARGIVDLTKKLGENEFSDEVSDKYQALQVKHNITLK
jgi:hypothetical protein